MTPEQRTAIRENLYNKSVKELVEALLDCYDELEEAKQTLFRFFEEAKQIRRRMLQIRNLCLDPDQRRKPVYLYLFVQLGS